jgi:hypothetical protein
MAYTYSKLATYTVGSGGIPSVTFLNIPQNYTDLVVKLSPKTTRTNADYEGVLCSINSNITDGSYSRKVLMNNSGSVVSGTGNDRYIGWTSTNSGTAANVFGNFELYFPNYTSSITKSYLCDFVNEGNFSAVTAQGMFSNLFSTSSAITSIAFTTVNDNNFAQYSTFHLYGIKAEL